MAKQMIKKPPNLSDDSIKELAHEIVDRFESRQLNAYDMALVLARTSAAVIVTHTSNKNERTVVREFFLDVLSDSIEEFRRLK